MFCANCGKKIENDTKFCEHCGVSTVNANEVKTSTIKINTVKKSKSKNIIFIIVAVAVVIVLVNIIAISIVGGSSKPSGTYSAKSELFGFSVAETAITFQGNHFNLEISSFGFSLDSDELNGSYTIEKDKIVFTFKSGLTVDGSFDIENNRITVIYVNFYDLGRLAFTK